jgi:hypothetical protein
MNLNVEIDTSGFSYVNGVIGGIAKGVKTGEYVSSILDYTHSQLNLEFEAWMDAAAAGDPTSLMHVYEWGQLGKPGGELWESVLRGHKNNRTATIIWKQSHVPTPVNPKLAAAGVKEGVHIFHWKAPVMEYGLQVTVSPRLAKTMAFLDDNGEIVLRKAPVTFESGGGHTRGQFTKRYYTWWNTIAQASFATRIAPKIERDLGSVLLGMKKMKSSKLSIKGDAAAYRRGENLGLRGLAKQQRDFIAGARLRRMALYGT